MLPKLPDVLDFGRFSHDVLVAENDRVVAHVNCGITGSKAIIKISEHWTVKNGKATPLMDFVRRLRPCAVSFSDRLEWIFSSRAKLNSVTNARVPECGLLERSFYRVRAPGRFYTAKTKTRQAPTRLGTNDPCRWEQAPPAQSALASSRRGCRSRSTH